MLYSCDDNGDGDGNDEEQWIVPVKLSQSKSILGMRLRMRMMMQWHQDALLEFHFDDVVSLCLHLSVRM